MKDEERFLEQLPRDGRAVGNISLQRRLGWDLNRYHRVRDRLLENGFISLGKGKGGSVRLVDGDMRALASCMPPDGSRVTHARLFKALMWDEARYNLTAQRLADAGIIAPGPRQTILFADTPVAEEWRLELALPDGVSAPFDAREIATFLGWPEHKLWEVRARCIENEHRGGGGEVREANEEEKPLSRELINEQPNGRGAREKPASRKELSKKRAQASVFVAYARIDDRLRGRLEAHMAGLRHGGAIDDWSDHAILPGEEWSTAIRNKLERADIVILLVSADFVASKYCYGVEMARALERHEEGSAHVIPVILRPCDWKATPMARLQALPRDGMPITRWQDEDEAFVDVVSGIRAVVASRHH